MPGVYRTATLRRPRLHPTSLLADAHGCTLTAMPTDDELRERIRSRIEVAVRGGYIEEKEILAHAEEDLEEPEEGAGGVEPLLAYARRLLDEQRAAELQWTGPTVNDAISRAFDALNSQGIVALENPGYTLSEGLDEAAVAARYSYERIRGVTYFHGQDVERGVLGAGLMLAFGALDEDCKPVDDDEASLAIAREVCETLARHGVPTEWNGSVKTRVHILPFEWRKRRWTTPPGGIADRTPRPTRFSCERVVQGVMHERGVTREDAIAALVNHFHAMALKHYGEKFAFEAAYEPENDRVELYRDIQVVEQLSDDPDRAVNERLVSQLGPLGDSCEPGDELVFQVFYLSNDAAEAHAQDAQYAHILNMVTFRRYMDPPSVQSVRKGVLEQLRAMGR